MARRLTGQKQKVQAHAEKMRALELAKQGLNYVEIGAALGHPRQWAHRNVKQALEMTVQEVAEEVRQVQLARLDALIVEQWQMLKSDLSPLVRLQVMDRILRTEERRARLLGLDAPVRQEVTGAEGGPLALILDK